MKRINMMGAAGDIVGSALTGGTTVSAALAAPATTSTSSSAVAHLSVGDAYLETYLEPLASELGVDRADLGPAALAAANAAIDAAATAGYITADLATELKADPAARDDPVTILVGRGALGGGPEHGGPGRRDRWRDECRGNRARHHHERSARPAPQRQLPDGGRGRPADVTRRRRSAGRGSLWVRARHGARATRRSPIGPVAPPPEAQGTGTGAGPLCRPGGMSDPMKRGEAVANVRVAARPRGRGPRPAARRNGGCSIHGLLEAERERRWPPLTTEHTSSCRRANASSSGRRSP
jgi:hypothetical protein